MTYYNPKPPSGKSNLVRQSAKGETCTLRLGCCNFNPETTILAHYRFFNWAGISQKPRDFLACYACSACHDAIDGRSKEPWGFEDLLRAMGETQMRLHEKGLLTMKGTK